MRIFQTGVVEMTWVVADHMAAPGSRELSVTKGQQVEVLENGGTSSNTPGGVSNTGEWTLVRLPLTPGQAEPPVEGLVPTSALKQPPTASCKTSPSRKASTQQQQQQSHQYHHQQQQQQSHHHPSYYQQQQINQAIVQTQQQQQQQTAVTSSTTANTQLPSSTSATQQTASLTTSLSSSAVLSPMLSEDAGE